jgi:hypothetical protein
MVTKNFSPHNIKEFSGEKKGLKTGAVGPPQKLFVPLLSLFKLRNILSWYTWLALCRNLIHLELEHYPYLE